MSDREWRFFSIEGGGADFVRTVNENLIAILQYDRGRALFKRIEDTGRTYRIEYVQNTFNSGDLYNLTTTNDPRMLCDPSYPLRENFEPTIQTVRERRKVFIYYWHELVHGLHVAEGSLGAWDAEEEFRTTGLYTLQYDAAQFTENALRRDAGLPRRPVYCWRGDNIAVLELEKRRRKNLGLPENPREYVRGVEDNFDRYWLRAVRMS
ncbi:MAG: hypothetical protein HY695_01775 [Deltaproteobacteria bacterium]|nr:hypothetical protein [Deltaproteobacteria bacterium]